MTTPGEILDVRSDELHLGDVFDEGVEVTELHMKANGWVKVVSNLSSSLEPAARIHRVMRADPSRLGLYRWHPEGTHVYSNVTTSGRGDMDGTAVETWGDLRSYPLPAP